MGKGPVIIYRRGRVRGGGGEDLGLQKEKFSRSPLWMLLHWSDPPNNIWWLSRIPPMSSFSAQIWVVPPLNPSKVFSDPPRKILRPRPPPPAINNDPSLKKRNRWQERYLYYFASLLLSSVISLQIFTSWTLSNTDTSLDFKCYSPWATKIQGK